MIDINPHKYIKIFGLRQHGVMPNGDAATAMIYVHSKMMIVDDRSVIIGSANINDRSLLGVRDTELAVLIEDTQTIQIRMSGEENYQASVYAHNLRRECFSQIFGVVLELTEDPLSLSFWDEVQRISSNNTKIYRELFNCYPDNKMKTFEDASKSGYKTNDLATYFQKIRRVQGLAVKYPLKFLEGEEEIGKMSFGLTFMPKRVFY